MNKKQALASADKTAFRYVNGDGGGDVVLQLPQCSNCGHWIDPTNLRFAVRKELEARLRIEVVLPGKES